MISFLIPIYNRNVNALVEELYQQGLDTDVEFEILLYDDASEQEFIEINRPLGHKMGVSIMELSKNLGRSKIRNWLGKNARFDWLVFMDCDSLIETPSFVSSYVEYLNKADVVYGGTSYQEEKPELTKRLHWKYGRKIEASPVSKRQKAPYESFRSNNFMIKRDVFLKYQFDENIKGYGYEDNVISTRMRQDEVKLVHIDNPLIHNGIEETDVFLKKTKVAIENLVRLYLSGSVNTRLIRAYIKLKDNGLLAFFQILDKWRGEGLYRSLKNANPSLFSFQWLKLRYLIAEIDEQKNSKRTK